MQQEVQGFTRVKKILANILAEKSFIFNKLDNKTCCISGNKDHKEEMEIIGTFQIYLAGRTLKDEIRQKFPVEWDETKQTISLSTSSNNIKVDLSIHYILTCFSAEI